MQVEQWGATWRGLALVLVGCAAGGGQGGSLEADGPGPGEAREAGAADASEASDGAMGEAASDAGQGSGEDQDKGPPPRDPNDVDEDGSRGGVDCDDEDPNTYPGAPERCDGKDNDCDGFVDTFPVDGRTYYPDADRDGLGDASMSVRSCEQPAGWVTNGNDCDDSDPEIGEGVLGEFCTLDERPVVYVALHGHDDNAGDAPDRAVRTVSKGIERALACPDALCSVLIAEGSYEEPVSLVEGVDLFGGYAADFTVRDGDLHPVVLTSSEPRSVVAQGLTRPTRLDGFIIQGAQLEGTDGASSYGLWVSDSGDSLQLTNMVIRAGRGADGWPGAEGQPTQCEARGGQGGTPYDCGASAGGEGDAAGDPESGGDGGDGGKSNCPRACPLVGSDGIESGKSGDPGGAGADGAGGEPVQDVLGSFVAGEWIGATGGDGQRGFHGTGGGGGGAGGTKRIRACFGCGTILGGRGGDGAPGGCGGGGGQGGGPGGAAIAMAVLGSQVALEDVVLAGGQGGDGGRGGDGIEGQPGGTETGGGHGDSSSKKCGLIRYRSGSGGVGGVGGAGGAGAGGAGGVGGAAITLVLADGAALSEAGTVEVLAGAGGVGGPGGEGPGLSGAEGLAGAAVDEHAFATTP